MSEEHEKTKFLPHLKQPLLVSVQPLSGYDDVAVADSAPTPPLLESSSSSASSSASSPRALTPLVTLARSLRHWRTRNEEPDEIGVDNVLLPLTPRLLCGRCQLPIGGNRAAFHKSVCDAVARVRTNPRARHRVRIGSPRYFADDVEALVLETLVAYANRRRATTASIPIDIVAGALLALDSPDTEKNILTQLGQLGGVEKLLRPFFIERLRRIGMQVHRRSQPDDGSFAVALFTTTTDTDTATRSVLLDDAVSRYTLRSTANRRRSLYAHELYTAHVLPSNEFSCRTAADLALSYWRVASIVDGIDVSHTPIDGALPSSIGALFGLEHLYAQSCRLDAFDAILSLGSLRSLNLSDNCIRSIPEQLAQACPLLEDVQLQRNSLECCPSAAIADLRHLRRLCLSSNRLTHLPAATVGGLPRLDKLDCGSNRLSVFPRDLERSTSLTLVDFSANEPKFAAADCDALRAAWVPRFAIVLR